MAGISALVAAAAVVGAAHIGARADTLVRPTVPLTISVVADGDRGQLQAGSEQRHRGQQDEQPERHAGQLSSGNQESKAWLETRKPKAEIRKKAETRRPSRKN